MGAEFSAPEAIALPALSYFSRARAGSFQRDLILNELAFALPPARSVIQADRRAAVRVLHGKR